ncbi:MAG: 4Fe-4S binding protein [Oscillospiraceae bacterium]|nr:4Fe-4S binding protein [Oscillospiraceae bacterium]
MKKNFKVVFDRDRCKGCELCINACPKSILALDSSVNNKGYHPACIVDQPECIGCSGCAIMCPDCCISIYELEEGETA